MLAFVNLDSQSHKVMQKNLADARLVVLATPGSIIFPEIPCVCLAFCNEDVSVLVACFFTECLMCFRRLLEEFYGLHCVFRGKPEVWIIHFLTTDACYIILILTLPEMLLLTKKNVGKVALKSLCIYIHSSVYAHTFWLLLQTEAEYNCICSVWLSSKMMQKVTSQNCP